MYYFSISKNFKKLCLHVFKYKVVVFTFILMRYKVKGIFDNGELKLKLRKCSLIYIYDITVAILNNVS